MKLPFFFFYASFEVFQSNGFSFETSPIIACTMLYEKGFNPHCFCCSPIVSKKSNANIHSIIRQIQRIVFCFRNSLIIFFVQ